MSGIACLTLMSALAISTPTVESVTDIDGNTHRLMGKPAVFVFVKTGCPIANYYHPTMRRLADSWGDDVALVFVHTEAQKSVDELKKHQSDYEVAGIVVHDHTGELVSALDATITPEAVVVGVAGEIRYSGRIDDKYLGFGKTRQVVSSHDLADAVNAVLTGGTVMRSRTKAVGCIIRRRD